MSKKKDSEFFTTLVVHSCPHKYHEMLAANEWINLGTFIAYLN